MPRLQGGGLGTNPVPADRNHCEQVGAGPYLPMACLPVSRAPMEKRRSSDKKSRHKSRT
jgi:hypothetical protein